MNADFLILGGGAMGLCLAHELVAHGSVTVIHHVERRSASWAAAGILPSAVATGHDSYDRLAALSARLHAEWAGPLEEESGISVEYWRCGGLHLATSPGEAASLAAAAAQFEDDGVEASRIPPSQLAELEPAISQTAGDFHLCYFFPGEAQVRPPRFLSALRVVCERRGVRFVETSAPPRPLVAEEQISGVRIESGLITAGCYCFAAGAWTTELLSALRVRVQLEPIRGQMILYGESGIRLERIVNEGPRYIVPRRDGRILVGSTVEEAGFDVSTCEQATRELTEFTRLLFPRLADQPVDHVWAGLRPRTGDGFPYVGAVPGLDNAFVATGHYRSGIMLAPGTAQVLSQMINGVEPSIKLEPFRVNRE